LLYEYANNLASINNLSLNFCLILIAVTAVWIEIVYIKMVTGM
jgi:hypothetical protein